MKKTLAVLFIVAVVGIPVVFGQEDVKTPGGWRPTTMEQRRNSDFDRRRAEMARVSNLPRERSREKIKRMTKAERKRFKAATTPSKEDRAAYRNFLKQKNTGMFRMLPNFNCESENVVRVDGKCKNFVPGTWAYSLRFEDFSNLDFHDLSFLGGQFVSEGLLHQGILTDLGTVAPKDFALTVDGMSYLNAFKPASDFTSAQSQYEKLRKGVMEAERFYSSRVDLRPGGTYGLRAVSYRMNDRWGSRLDPKNADRISLEESKFALLLLDRRYDATYIFRVVRQDKDGAVTILWKRLAKGKAPKIRFEKKEPLRDFKTK